MIPGETMRIVGITCHFGDSFWIENAIQTLSQLNIVSKLYISDQMGTGLLDDFQCEPLRLKNHGIPNEIVRVKEFSSTHASFQHANSIKMIAEKIAQNSEIYDFVLLFDSDVVFRRNFLEQLSVLDHSYAYLAQDGINKLHSHPCFQLIPFEAFLLLNYAPIRVRTALQKELLVDTGRLIHLQLIDLGKRPVLIDVQTHSRIFAFHFPDTYFPNESILHFKSMSFSKRPDAVARFGITDFMKYEFGKFLALSITRTSIDDVVLSQAFKKRIVVVKFLFFCLGDSKVYKVLFRDLFRGLQRISKKLIGRKI
jgi:hypothetical protein